MELYPGAQSFSPQKCYQYCNQLHHILTRFDVLPNFLSPQMKRCAIITYKSGIYELPHELRLRKLGHIRRVPKPHRMIA